jgi:uncharacterized protein (DUF983 family)
MGVVNSPEQDPSGPDGDDPLARFRNWRGFLFAAIAVNALFVYGMLGSMADANATIWYKALSWLPFNAIATALYLMFLVKLTKADEDCAMAVGSAEKAGTGGGFYAILCIAMIIANWWVMFAA